MQTVQVNSDSRDLNATNLALQLTDFEEQLIVWEIGIRERCQEALHAIKPTTLERSEKGAFPWNTDSCEGTDQGK